MLLANLFRDQLDRYGELEIIADRWAAIVARTQSALVLNADDPLVADLGREREALYFGVQDDALALPELQHASDSKHCRRCGHAYEYEAAYLAHLGRYACPNCGARRPDPQVHASAVGLRGIRSAAFTLTAPEGAELDLFGVLNDRTADGRDVSWVWDADWEIVAPHVRRLTCSGTRAAELALRLKYAGVEPSRLDVVEDVERGLDRALASGDGPLYALPTYTALLELKDVLSRRGHEEYWR
jgi:UDP-N-acetylmuramyl tripeptide synthase